jgi:hypothetical protein
MNPRNFFGELKRRNVYKVAVAYAVVGWLLVQVATQVFPFFEIPNWTVRFLVLLIMAGFPIALIIAWAFELTHGGVKRTEDADAGHERSGGAVWIYIVAIGAVLSIGLFVLGRYTAPNKRNALAELPGKSIAVLPFAVLYAIRKEPDEMFNWLETAYATHDSGLAQLAVTPFFLPYVDDARFAALCQKLNVQVPSASAKP